MNIFNPTIVSVWWIQVEVKLLSQTALQMSDQRRLFNYKFSKFVTVILFLLMTTPYFITNRFNIQRFYFLLAQCTYVNSMYLRRTSDVCPI
jgi:hypothetical protein